jgi:ubiquinone biosynthesis protein UbiJ
MIENEIEINSNLKEELINTKVENMTPAEVASIIENNGLDPFETNSQIIRDIAGHGSTSTIQKALKAIRLKIKPPPAVLSGTIPAASPEVVKALWEAAYTAVQMQVFAKIEGLTAQRDQASQVAEAQANDIESFACEIDELHEKIATLDEKIDKMKTSFSAQESSFEHDKEDWMHQLGEKQSEIDFVRTESRSAITDARHAAEIAIRDATIREQALQSTIGNLINQIADLKSILIERSAPINQT